MDENQWQPAITRIPKEHTNEMENNWDSRVVGIKVFVKEAAPDNWALAAYRAAGCDSKRFFNTKITDELFAIHKRQGPGWLCEHEILTD